MNETTPPPSEAQIQAEAKKHARARDFKEVFGWGAARTAAQQRVLDYLETFGDDDENSFVFRGGDGLSIIAAGIHRDGAKSIIRVINRNLSLAQSLGTPPKPKARTTR